MKKELFNDDVHMMSMHDKEIEETVLSLMIAVPKDIVHVVDIISLDCFFEVPNRKVYSSLMEMWQNGDNPDFISLCHKVRSKDGDLMSHVTHLYSKVAGAAGSEMLVKHALILKQLHLAREAYQIVGTAMKEIPSSPDVFTTIESIQHSLSDLVVKGIKRREYDTDGLIKGLTEAVEEAVAESKKGGFSGVPTMIPEVNVVTGGFKKQDLVILAARPGMGKTAFVKTVSNGCMRILKKPVAIFSLEMSAIQMWARFISEEVDMPSSSILEGKSHEHFFKRFHSEVKRFYHNDEPLLYIDDTPTLNVYDIKARARRLKNKHDIQLVVVDYMQLIKPVVRGGNRQEDISEISRELKIIAKELNIPVLALSQLSRAVESRGGDRRPQLSDLRESGAIEQDADTIMFLYRPDYYAEQGVSGFDSIMVNGQEQSSKGIAQVILAKQRNGKLGKIPVKFTDYLTKFSSINETFDVPFVSEEEETSNKIQNSRLSPDRLSFE